MILGWSQKAALLQVLSRWLSLLSFLPPYLPLSLSLFHSLYLSLPPSGGCHHGDSAVPMLQYEDQEGCSLSPIATASIGCEHCVAHMSAPSPHQSVGANYPASPHIPAPRSQRSPRASPGGPPGEMLRPRLARLETWAGLGSADPGSADLGSALLCDDQPGDQCEDISQSEHGSPPPPALSLITMHSLSPLSAAFPSF